MKKYIVKAEWYRKASGSCRSYIGKKATPIEWKMETLKEAEEWVEELKKQPNPYKYYDNIKIEEEE